MTLLIIKIFSFGFKNADREDIETEKNKLIEGQDAKDCKSKLKEKFSSKTEKA